PHHRGGKSIAEMTVENEIGDRKLFSDQIHHRLPRRQDALQLRREREIGFILVLAALGTPARSFGSLGFTLLFALSRLLLLFLGANDLLDREGIGTSLRYIDEGDREERQTGNDGI